jgi:hypothetical protein
MRSWCAAVDRAARARQHGEVTGTAIVRHHFGRRRKRSARGSTLAVAR